MNAIYSSSNFKPGPKFQVKEVLLAKLPKFLPIVPTKWDFHHYHGRDKSWRDPALEKARLAKVICASQILRFVFIDLIVFRKLKNGGWRKKLKKQKTTSNLRLS
jgi:hypothetical protein